MKATNILGGTEQLANLKPLCHPTPYPLILVIVNEMDR